MKNRITDVSKDIANKDYFDHWAKHYHAGRISRWFQYTQRLAIEILDLQKEDAAVLDVGCGTGYAVTYLGSIRPQGKACGIDLSLGMIEEAWANVPADLRERVGFFQASSADLPYAAESFDGIICTNSFHHYPDPLCVLGEMHRVLKPGGKVVVLENAPDLSWYTWAWDRLLRVIEKGHVRYYPSKELGGMLRQAGFAQVTLCYLKNEFIHQGKLWASIQVWSGDKSRDH